MHALAQRARLRAGETLVVLGARVIACASSPGKVALARAHGAAEGIDYAAADLRAELRRLAPGGVDVVYDPVGGAETEIALRPLGWRGRLRVIGFASGEIPRPPLNIALVKGADILGVEWAKFVLHDATQNRGNMSRVTEWAAAGKLATHIHSIHDIADLKAAFAEIAERRAVGKVLLRFHELFMPQE
jgi:NADPH:quinone reductase